MVKCWRNFRTLRLREEMNTLVILQERTIWWSEDLDKSHAQVLEKVVAEDEEAVEDAVVSYSHNKEVEVEVKVVMTKCVRLESPS